MAVPLGTAAGPAAAQGTGGGTPCDPLPNLQIHPIIRPAAPCIEDEVSLVLFTCEPCTELLGVQKKADGSIGVMVQVKPSACRTLAPCVPDSIVVDLGRFEAGEQRQRISYDVRVVEDSLVCTATAPDEVQWFVSERCPAPPPNQLPYLDHVIIGDNLTAGVLPMVCPNDSFPVRLVGRFPNDCLSLAGVELIQYPTFGIAPAPPIVRIKYLRNDCAARPCLEVETPWSATVMLPGLPTGGYDLPLEAYRVSDFCVEPPDSTLLGRITRRFEVVDQCSTNTLDCLDASWAISSDRGDRCDAFVGPERPDAVTLKIGSGVALAGLEGRLHMRPEGLRIVKIEPVGPAEDMNLDWRRTEDGARFVLFAKDGAPIPGGTLPPDRKVPVLRVFAEPTENEGFAPRTLITVGQLLGSTLEGRGVIRCPRPAVIRPDDFAVFCRGAKCDFDQNGRADVRDLVRMIRCLRSEGPCPPGSESFDCNGDAAFNLDDVFCCARVILRGPRDEPGDGRKDDSIQLALGQPVESGDEFEVPMQLTSGTPLGGARLALRFPADRFEIVRLEAPDAGRIACLLLHEAVGDEVVLGMLPLAQAGIPSDLRLVMRLKPGQTAAGSITLTDAEFSDGDGATLIADLGSVSTSLGAGSFQLSPGTPNPFSSSLTFSVTLPEDSDLQVGVFDLGGRRVSTLHRGPASAGVHAFQWDGRDANGSRVRGGVYFVRAQAAGQLISRKAVFLGGR